MTTTQSFHWTDGPSASIVAAVSKELDTDPDELEPPLHDFIDPDALDALFAPTHRGARRPFGRVTFSMHGCSVTVDDSGSVTATLKATSVNRQSQTDESRTYG